MKNQNQAASQSQARARGLYDEQLQRLQQEKRLLKREATARELEDVE